MNGLLIVLFGLLQVADGVVTYLGLRFADVVEVNPLLNYCAAQMGLGTSISTLKLLILALIAYLFFARHKMKNRWGTATLFGAVSFYSWVVSNNLLLVVGD